VLFHFFFLVAKKGQVNFYLEGSLPFLAIQLRDQDPISVNANLLLIVRQAGKICRATVTGSQPLTVFQLLTPRSRQGTFNSTPKVCQMVPQLLL
jgi:hypothetical protein